MKTSEQGINIIKKFEEVRLKSYQDVAGVWTIGFGSTRYANGKRVGPNETITPEVADTLLRTKVNEIDADINSAVKVDLTQNQHDALVDFTYNLGDGSLRGSTLLGLLNHGNYEGAANQFDLWVKAANTKTGKKESMLGLIRRRAFEKALFLKK